VLTFDEANHVYTLDGEAVPSVTQILKAEGFIDDSFYDEYSRDRGTAVHKAIHLHNNDDLDEESLDPVIAPYLEAWKKFKRETGLVVSESEKAFASERYRFAGTIDVLGTFPDTTCIILDIKTGGPAPWHGLQLSAYDILQWAVGRKRYGVYLSGEGTYKLNQYKDRQDREIFLSALSCYHWKHNHKIGGKR
jgi:hypothetical protein